jgi:hypothetical protein
MRSRHLVWIVLLDSLPLNLAESALAAIKARAARHPAPVEPARAEG